MIKTLKQLSILACTASALSVIGTPALAATHMQMAGLTSQPIGHHIFCQSYPSECKVKTKDTSAPKLTRELWKQMVDVNAYSNSTITPVTDLEGFGVEEHWVYPTSFGDCEDYVLMKRHMLIQKGWPPSALLITVVLQANGEGHAVLTVRTDKADYILDNLNGKILPWHETEYTYLKRQSEKHSGRWTKILDHRS